MSIEGISQQETGAFWSNSATSNERILQQVTSDLLQRATSITSNEQVLQRGTSDFTTSEFQRVTSNE